MDVLVHMLVPEMFWKEYRLNKPGVLEHPISLYTAYYMLGILFKVKLHNPAYVQFSAKDIANPTCVSYKSGVIFVAEKSCLSYLDVGNVNFCFAWRVPLYVPMSHCNIMRNICASIMHLSACLTGSEGVKLASHNYNSEMA